MRQAVESILKDTLKDSYLFMAEDMSIPVTSRDRSHLWKERFNKGFTYFTPNTFDNDKSKCRDNLVWLNCFFLDIDNSDNLQDDVLDKFRQAGLPVPTFVNKSPHGFHAFLVFDQPVPATPENIKQYDNIVKHITREIEGDAKGPERYIRIPKNIIYRTDKLYSFEFFQDWHEINEEDVPKLADNVTFLPIGKCLAIPGIKVLLGGVEEGIRDNSAFTLALAFRSDSYTPEQTLGALTLWNRKNSVPLPERTIRAKIRSAYSGRYSGPSPEWIERLSGIACSPRIITPAKSREQRRYLHYYETKLLILEYIRRQSGTISLSQAKLAEAIRVPLSSLKKCLRSLADENKLCVVVAGKGRGAVTTYRVIETAPVSMVAYRDSHTLQKVIGSIGIHSIHPIPTINSS